MYLGSWKIGDALTFCVNTHSTAHVAADADSPPTYRVYEDEAGIAMLTGSMALLDSVNTNGFYSEQLSLTAENGFERGKCYTIRIEATVGGVTGTTERTFQILAPVDASIVSDKTGYDLVGSVRVKLHASQPDYAPALAGAAMTLTSGERAAVAAAVEAAIINETDSAQVLKAITDKIAQVNPSLDDLTLGAIAAATRAELERNGGMLISISDVVAVLSGMISNGVFTEAALANGPSALVSAEGITSAVWGNEEGIRNLTSPGGSDDDPPAGAAITIRQGDLWAHSFTGLGPIGADDKVYFTLRRLSSEGTDDSDALVHLGRSAGLLVISGAAATGLASRASLAIDNAGAGNVTVTLQPAATKLLPVLSRQTSVIVYGVKVIRAADADGNTVTSGAARILPAVTRATS